MDYEVFVGSAAQRRVQAHVLPDTEENCTSDVSRRQSWLQMKVWMKRRDEKQDGVG
jgi:hypothetical protein